LYAAGAALAMELLGISAKRMNRQVAKHAKFEHKSFHGFTEKQRPKV
jgi:hypothetical protein